MGTSLVLVACVLSSLVARADTAAPATPRTPVLTEAGKQAIRAAFATGIERALIAGGSLLLIQDGAVIFDEGFGVKDLTSREPFTAREAVQLASISKPHTAAVILRLVESGQLELDVPISNYIPAFATVKLKATGETVAAPTLRQLLSHTAGFAGLRDPTSNWFRILYTAPSMNAAAEAFAADGLAYAPGTGYAYGQPQFVVAANIAERVTGKPFEVLLQELLARPLGAERVTFFPDRALLSTLPTRYNRRDGALQPAPPRNHRVVGEPFDPAGSLVGDAPSVAKLFQLHLDGGRVGEVQVLSPQTIELMRQNQPGANGYGLGLNLAWMPDDGSPPIIRHGGAFGTMAWADFETRVVGVLLTQTTAAQVPEWGPIIYGALHEAGFGRMVDGASVSGLTR